MRVKKKVRGKIIELNIEWIKNYPTYGLYQISKIEHGKQIPLYRECFTSEQMKDIISKKLIETEEVFE